MHLAELWRYPVKSLRGEPLEVATLTENGLVGDRIVHVRGKTGRPLTARTRPRLLGLAGTLGADGEPRIDGRHWQDPMSTDAITEAAGPGARLVRYTGPERFDILPLLVATDGAITALGHDPRRLRPNVLIAGVPGLAERTWPGKTLRIADVLIGIHSLRARCIMTTIDPDTGAQNLDILRRINREFDSKIALDGWVARGGQVRIGDPAELLDIQLTSPPAGGWVVGAPYQT